MLLVAAVADLSAQGTEFSLGGGLGVPLGTFDEFAKVGWQGTAGVSLFPGNIPVAIRVDGSLARFSDETPLDIKSQLMFGTANAVYKFQSSTVTRWRPYVIGGIGVYNSKATGEDAPEGSTTDAGINLGAGFDVQAGGAGLFVEARWHNVFLEGDNRKFLPITLGIRLGGS
ncbi:MAG TPA: hypothetical protein VFZ87_05255 [Gemmatimonadales bacterium]